MPWGFEMNNENYIYILKTFIANTWEEIDETYNENDAFFLQSEYRQIFKRPIKIIKKKMV